MANTRSIQSPGVEIREIDLSTRATTPNGTNIFITGFAPQGPTYEIHQVSTLDEFEALYGTPTTAAERYFYYSVREAITDSINAVVSVARLPYGGGAGEGFSSLYSALVFPVLPIPAAVDAATYTPTVVNTAGMPLSAAAGYYIGEPALVSLTYSDYTTIQQGGLQWQQNAGAVTTTNFNTTGNLSQLASAGIIVLNTAKTTINEKFEGLYLNLTDAINLDPASNYDDAVRIRSIGSTYFASSVPSYANVPSTRLSFALSAAAGTSIQNTSLVIENIPTFNIGLSGYDDTVILSLFKIRPSPFTPNTILLDYVLQEGYTGSFYVNRKVQDPLGGAPDSFFLKTLADQSPTIDVFINPWISSNAVWLDSNGNSLKKVRIFRTDSYATATNAPATDPSYTFYTVASSYLAAALNGTLGVSFYAANNLYALGVYQDTLPTNAVKIIGDVGSKLDAILTLAENPDTLPIDITIEAGIATVYAATLAAGLSSYDENLYPNSLAVYTQALSSSAGNPVSNALVDAWNAITSRFEVFARSRRRDHIFISDPLRSVLIQGANFKTLDNRLNSFSQNVYWPLRNLYTGYNSSYMTTYGTWVKITDTFSGRDVWLPFSGYAAAAFARTDNVAYPWIAPAGYDRGVINGISDIAINPQQKQRDQLYKVSVNPVMFSPNDGYIMMGQKTMLKTPSAFDRINVRRLFLYLEKATLATTKYFVFEPNTTFTRSRVVNTLNPIFTLAKNTQGVYDYLVVCNDKNNTPDVIDDNTLVVDIYIKPVRAAEFILVNFYATKTSQDFNELLQA